VLGNIENSFNYIWGVRKARTIGRKFSDYLSIILICPILLMVASSVTVFVSTQITQLTERLAFLGPLSSLITFCLKLLPYVALWGLFTFIYVFLPNTKVSLKAGVIAGIAAGTLYQLVQWGYLHFQIGVSKYNAVYGSFAALPLFLIWLQISWLVVLLGAEVSFAVDNEETYEFEQDCRSATPRFKRLLALRIAELLVKNFEKGNQPLSSTALAHQLDAPIRLVRELLFNLVSVQILSEVKQNGTAGEFYQPALDPDRLTVKRVLDALDRQGQDNPGMVKEADLNKIDQTVDAMNQAIESSPKNVLLRDL
jgi:membrane protein